MGDAALLDRIQSLIAAPPATRGGPTLDRIEDVLTEGYACALALEAERWRLERRLGEVAAEFAGGQQGRTEELASIARRMAAADGDLVRLRAALASLRDRASETRAA
ncbi:MAG: hypothetical protein M3168_00615 [Actinomycetota bacterium]|nr:hypothetical protein [Actinomycetota bacterium]